MGKHNENLISANQLAIRLGVSNCTITRRMSTDKAMPKPDMVARMGFYWIDEPGSPINAWAEQAEFRSSSKKRLEALGGKVVQSAWVKK